MEQMKKIKALFKRESAVFCRYVNGTKGVISLFLALLMVPFVSVAGMLINAARINSAVSIFDEALCNASNSTLGTYDKFLHERFGLLAMSQNTASMGQEYTAQDFIQETFQFYMEQNLGVMSNTFFDAEVSATGIYPLSDTEVLRSQVLEYGNYTIPAKLVVDGLSLDDILNTLTKKLGLVKSVVDTLTAEAKMGSAMISCQESLDTLKTSITSCETAKSEYTTAYNEFRDSVTAYNQLIDDLAEAIEAADTEIETQKENIVQAEEDLEMQAELQPVLVKKLVELENEKDSKGNKVDNTEKIKEFIEDNETELEGYLMAKEALEDAEEAKAQAETDRSDAVSQYNEEIATARTDVATKKATYESKIASLAGAVKSTGDATKSAQSSVSTLVTSGVSVIKNVANTAHEAQKTGIDQQIKDMKEEQKKAEQQGDTAAVNSWSDKIKDATVEKVKIENIGKVEGAYTGGLTTGVNSINQFANLDVVGAYQNIYTELISLRNNVRDNYKVETQNKKMSGTAAYYLAVGQPMSVEDVETMQQNMAGELLGTTAIAFLKALASFVQALFKLQGAWDPSLSATINFGYYSDLIGGLPSKKNRADTSTYSLKSEFEKEDSRQSAENKEMLGEYSKDPSVYSDVNVFQEIIDTVQEDIDTICTCFDEITWKNCLKKLGEIGLAVADILYQIVRLVTNIRLYLAGLVYEKALVAGYLGYNTANRTTYNQLTYPLTESRFELPPTGSANEGIAFYGAETEYIIGGSRDETTNQVTAFGWVYLIRLLFNLIYVSLNTEVGTIASQVGAATFGIGAVVVYVLYFLAEPLVDSLILVSRGDVPIIKTNIYLTPTGIVKLIEKFIDLKMDEKQKQDIYADAAGMINKGFGTELSMEYDPKKGDLGVVDKIGFDYTKTLILAMMFGNEKTMLKRLSDIIQMEATQRAKKGQIDTYTFDLDKSYTYLRASGSFSANEFIKLSDKSGFVVKDQVVYRGY